MKGYKFITIEATEDAYEYYSTHIKPLPKKADGKLDTSKIEDHDNDLDAFRHSYVSGRITQKYWAGLADLGGRINEGKLGNTEGPKNMDLWNNHVGRKYGLQTKSKLKLLELLKQALQNGELIITPADPRRYEGEKLPYIIDPLRPVIAIEESDTGRNVLFIDLLTESKMTLEAFVAEIEKGNYPGYYVAEIDGQLTPVSRPDDVLANNLG